MSKAAVRDATRPALRLTPAGPVGIRTPAFPAALLHAVHTADDGRKALHGAFTRDPDLWGVVATASVSLGDAATRWLAGAYDADDGIAISLYAYLARSSMRATPFAACATVGIAGVSESGADLQCSEMRIRARPDAEWLHHAGEALERDVCAFERLALRPSGLVHEFGGRLEVADVARAELRSLGSVRSLVPIPTAFNATAAVTLLLTSCEPGMTVSDLATRVAGSLDADSREVVALIAKLTAIGVFVTEGRPALGDRPADALARAYHKCTPENAVVFDEFRSSLASASNVTLREVPAILASSRDIAARIAATPHIAQIDALRTYDGSLPMPLLSRLGAVIEKLAELSPQTREPRLLAHGFRAKYNAGRYIPLLELLDPAEGLAFESLISVPDPAVERIDGALAEIAMHAIAERISDVPLEGDLYAKLLAARGERSPDFRAPAHLEAIAMLRSGHEGNLDVSLTGRVHEGRSTSLGRFGDLLAVPLPHESDDGTIFAEFVGTPYLRRVGNIINQSTRTQYVFCCGASSDRDPEHIITPADVVVGCEGSRLVMRLRHSGKTLRVIFSHRLNAGFASRLAAFVQYVSFSDLALVGLPWGSVSRRLPFRPRLTIDGITVAPAQWRIPASVALDLNGPAGQAWRERWMLPNTFEIAETDNYLPVDVRSGIACAYLRKIANRVPVIEATEMIPSFDDAVVAGPGGRYVAEIAVTYAVSHAASTGGVGEPAIVVAEPPALALNTLRAPGSEWIFAKLYMGAERMNHFLESEVTVLHGFADAADDWHFLRYADPDQHLRIRFRVADEARRSTFIIDLYAWFNALIGARKLRRVAIDTYDREEERYGGAGRIGIAERLFTVDSVKVMPLLKVTRQGEGFAAWLAADVTSFAIALTGSAAHAKDMLRASLQTRRKLSRESWETVRVARGLRDADRYAAIATLGNAILDGLSLDAGREVANALLHMHCNRFGMTGEGERHIRSLSAGICEGLLHE